MSHIDCMLPCVSSRHFTEDDVRVAETANRRSNLGKYRSDSVLDWELEPFVAQADKARRLLHSEKKDVIAKFKEPLC